MKLNKRTLPVQSAKSFISGAILTAEKDYDLTLNEVIKICAEIITHYSTYALRVERHGPNSDKKADDE